MSRTTSHRLLCLTALTLGACTIERVSDLSAICLNGDELNLTFAACSSSSGRTVVGTSCTVTASEDMEGIEVDATARIRVAPTGNDDCRTISTTCDVADVPRGEDGLVIRNDSLSGTLLDGECLGEAPF